ncbi:hypothetical protein CAL7716_085360 [Calothrix sp. PCC 7716]|nr:hypothetical protein CAL7716_085360 [Calothrix sp. PCC 7716]
MGVSNQAALIVGLPFREIPDYILEDSDEFGGDAGNRLDSGFEKLKQHALESKLSSSSQLEDLDYIFSSVHGEYFVGFVLGLTSSYSSIEIEALKLKDVETFITQFENIFKASPQIILMNVQG